jgi:LysR family transcriptional regulator, transcriptional activator of nhaA
MEWLNYHHLLYFWTVARLGTVAQASEELSLAPPTISGQVHRLEEVLGERLFARRGRRLVLTDVGRMVYRYAEEIFSLGRELQQTLNRRPTTRPLRLIVGVEDVLPKPIVRMLLEPLLRRQPPVRVVCREDRSLAGFLAELGSHSIDLVLADAPLTTSLPVRAFSHLLGDCGTTFFAARPQAPSWRRRFPRSLDGAPCLLPGASSALRRSLDAWFHAQAISPRIVGEFDDPALVNAFAQEGLGVFAAPSVLEEEMRRRHGLSVVGRAEALRQRFYAISAERRLEHPAVVALRDSARSGLFPEPRARSTRRPRGRLAG